MEVLFVGDLAEHHPLEHPQHVTGGEDNAGGADGGIELVDLEGPEEDEKLAHEAVQARQPDGGQGHDHKDGGKDGHDGGQPAKLGNQTGVAALIDAADDKKQGAGGEPVVDHLDHAPLDPLHVEGEEPQHDKAQMGDRGEGDKTLDVRLHHGDQGPVYDADDRQDAEQRHEIVGGLREQGHVEAQEAVGPHLQEHRRQDDRAHGGRFGVGVRQPGVEGEHGHLDGKGDGEGQEHPELHVEGDVQAVQAQQIEGISAGDLAVIEVEHQNGHQHEQGAEHGVQEELDGGVDPAGGVAPDADQQVHGDELQFPEHVEQEDVQGGEDADHAGQHEEQADHEFLHPVLDVVPGGQHTDGGKERRQENQKE